ncbi:hypothetical protein, partial [Coleofasciculus sp. F4-SAH-05]|uniref:hypothetical protein n=1 Tax=Coleofasciculus sp. F4-SAH-05 TaxID=3069525 RepID=UPI0032F2CA6E
QVLAPQWVLIHGRLWQSSGSRFVQVGTIKVKGGGCHLSFVICHLSFVICHRVGLAAQSSYQVAFYHVIGERSEESGQMRELHSVSLHSAQHDKFYLRLQLGIKP